MAAVDVRKSISFCRQINLPILGVVANMNGFVCPKCGELSAVFRSGGGRQMAEEMQVPFLGSMPVDPEISESGDSGVAFLQRYKESPTAAIFNGLMKPIMALDE